MAEAKKPRIFSGYTIVAVAFLILAIIPGTFSTFGVFFTPMLSEFGWSRAAFSAASSIAFITMGILAIVMGAFTDKVGPRIVMFACGILFGMGHLLLAHINALWQLYSIWIVIGIGMGASDVVPLGTVARWFVKRRGIMSGIAKVGTGLGIMALPLIAGILIDSFGWRISYTILGIFALATIIPLSLLLRRDPYQAGQLPDGCMVLSNDVKQTKEGGLSFSEAVSSRLFWMVFTIYFAAQFCGQTIMVHMAPHALDLGALLPQASGAVAAIGGSSIVGRLVIGFANDRIGNQLSLVICFIILVVALSWLQLAGNVWMLYVFAIVYGFSHGGFFALLAPTVAGLFGTRSQGLLLGIVIFGGTCGGATGSYMAGKMFDVYGSYSLIFLLLLILPVTGLILSASMKPLKPKGEGNGK